MKHLLAAAAALALAGVTVAAAQQPAAATKQAGKPRPRLSLGPWGAHYSDGPPGTAILPDSPRFRDHVEVQAAPRDINTTMQQWWDSYNLEYSIYGRGLNVRNPGPTGGVPLISLSWGGKNTKNHTRNPPLPPGPEN